MIRISWLDTVEKVKFLIVLFTRVKSKANDVALKLTNVKGPQNPTASGFQPHFFFFLIIYLCIKYYTNAMLEKAYSNLD